MERIAKDRAIKSFCRSFTKAAEALCDCISVQLDVFNKKTRYKASLRLYDYFDADRFGILSTFRNISLLSGSYKFLSMGIFKDENDAVQNTVEKHIRAFGKDNVSVVSARILKALKGIIPFRKLNIKRNYVQ
jgi:hypothetical protein